MENKEVEEYNILTIFNSEYDKLLFIRTEPSVQITFKNHVIDMDFFVKELLWLYPTIIDLTVQGQVENVCRLLMGIQLPESIRKNLN